MEKSLETLLFTWLPSDFFVVGLFSHLTNPSQNRVKKSEIDPFQPLFKQSQTNKNTKILSIFPKTFIFFLIYLLKILTYPQPTYIYKVFCKFFLKLSKNNCRKIWRMKQRPQIFAVSMVQSPAIQRAWHSKTSVLYIMRHRLFRAEEQSSSPAEYNGHGTTLL